jgi:glycolate oxidase
MIMTIHQDILQSIIPDHKRLIFDNIQPKYLSDTLGRLHGKADALIFARSTEEVSAVLKYANEHRIPVTPRGAGNKFGWINRSCGRWYYP